MSPSGRPGASFGGTLNHWRLPRQRRHLFLVVHAVAPLLGFHHGHQQRLTAAFGFFSTQSERMPSATFRWPLPGSPVVAAVEAMPWLTSCSFQGSPTQKTSMLPTFMFATI